MVLVVEVFWPPTIGDAPMEPDLSRLLRFRLCVHGLRSVQLAALGVKSWALFSARVVRISANECELVSSFLGCGALFLRILQQSCGVLRRLAASCGVLRRLAAS